MNSFSLPDPLPSPSPKLRRAVRRSLLTILAVAAPALLAPRLDAAALKLDFVENGGQPTGGWIAVGATKLGNDMVNVANVGGSGYNFSIDHVGVWDNNNLTQSLTHSGFYNSGKLTNTHGFTLSGVKPNKPVALYACSAWDGTGAGGYVVFGDNAPNGVKAVAIDNPGNNPTLANLTYIGSAVADGSGAVSGSLHGQGGVGSDTEGQVGGFVFLPTQTLTASAGANGSISPTGAVDLLAGQNQSFTITANSGYHIADVLVDGVSAGAVGTYAFTGVNSDHTISVSFAADTTLYTINASAGANGSINPSGAVSANQGINKPFTITPNSGYRIADVLVDGVSVGPVSDYSFLNVAANHSISASFAIKTYTVDATTNTGGMITPAGATQANHGADLEYEITPAEGYYVAQVLVDGVSVGAVEYYAFSSLSDDHTIDVTFDNRTRLQLDFGESDVAATQGWTKVSGNSVADTPLATALDIGGLGYNFSFSHVACWDNDQSFQPLTRSGFYTFQNLTWEHNFALTGLNAGQTVHLYACAAWDGNPAGGYVLFGDNAPNGVKAQTVGSAGEHPTLANMTLIGTAVSDITGTVSGSLHGRDGVNTNIEGQVGAFVFILEAGGSPPVNAFSDWAEGAPYNLTGADALPSADPDHDGVSNLLEFGLNGSPVSGASDGLSGGSLASVGGQSPVMTYTIAVRNGAAFSPDGNRMKSNIIDGISYTVEAATTLEDWGVPAVTEVTGADATAIQTGLPTPEAGWTYKTFRTAGTAPANAKSFIRVEVE